MDDLDKIINQNPEEQVNQLSDKQQKWVLEAWNNAPPDNPPSLKALTELCWGVGTDSRTWKGRLVREFLATRQLKARLAQDYIPKGKVELVEAQKEYITNNCAAQNPLEMAKIIFNNNNLTPLHAETRAVIEFIKTVAPAVANNPEVNDLITDKYTPPRTMPQVLSRINRYVFKTIDEKTITPKMKKNLWTLIGYMHTPRFLSQISTYHKESDRILFESEFIRCVYDKDDLTEEEVDQYIIYATEVLIGASILDRVNTLEREQDRTLQEENGRLNLALVENVKALRDDYNKSVTRQNRLLSDLKGKRSERLNSQLKETASILNLVELWKEEDTRKQLLALAKREQDSIKEEIQRLNSLDEVKAKIMGLTPEEAMFG